MSRVSKALRALTGPAALALTLAACSSGGGGASAASDGNGTPPPSAASPSATGCQAQAGLTGTVLDHGTEQVSGTKVALQAEDTFFQPTCVVVSGGKLTVTITNVGTALHNFSVTSLGIDQDVQPGQTITVNLRFDGASPLPFLCKYHVGAGMQGAFLPA